MSKKQSGIDLRARLTNRPLAIAARAVDAAMLRPLPVALFGEIQTATPDRQGWQFTDGGIALLPVMGPLFQRGDKFTKWLGITSYDDIADAAESAMSAPNTRGVLMEIDSPGGEVAGLFDLVDYLAALKATYGKPIWAVARDQALSAAYTIASVADRVIITQTGEAGSVGIIAIHVDKSAQDQMEGEKYSLIYAGAKKANGNKHIPLSPSAAGDIQADIDDIYARFVSHVARNRRLTPQAVTATEAAIYRGQHAIDAGFADQIGTLEGAHADLVASLDHPMARQTAPKTTPKTSQSQERTRQMANQNTLRTPVEEATQAPANNGVNNLSPENESPAAAVATPAAPAPAAVTAPTPATAPTPPAPVAPVVAAPAPASPQAEMEARIRAEAAEITMIGAQAQQLGVSIDAVAAVRDGTSPDALRQAILTQLANNSAAAAVAPFAPPVAGAALKKSALVAAVEATVASQKH